MDTNATGHVFSQENLTFKEKMSTGDPDGWKRNDCYFALLKDKNGEVIPQTIIEQSIKKFGKLTGLRKSSSKFPAFKGDLFKLAPDNDDLDNSRKGNNLVSVHDPTHFLLNCDPEDLQELNSVEYMMLLSVNSHNERFEALSLLDEYCKINVGDVVFVSSDVKAGHLKQGKVTYRGEMRDGTGKGYYFGVKFEEPFLRSGPGIITNEGDRKQAFFAVNHISVAPELPPSSKKPNNKAKSSEEIKLYEKGENPRKVSDKVRQYSKNDKKSNKGNTAGVYLSEGTRVVCFLGKKEYRGTVKFFDNVGSTGLQVGVELDEKNPMNKRQNYHNSKLIFPCKPGHGLLIEPQLVLKEDDFLGVNDKKETYVTTDDNNVIKQVELETKAVKRSLDPRKEQMKILQQFEQKKASGNAGNIQNANPNFNNTMSEEGSQYKLSSHNQNVQRLNNDVTTKTSSIQLGINHNSSYVENKDPRLVASSKMPSQSLDYSNQNPGYGNAKKLSAAVSDGDHKIPTEYTAEQLNLQEGSLVEIEIQSKIYTGLLKWKGKVEKLCPETIYVGVEVDNDELNGCSDGTFLNEKRFSSPLNRAFFVKLHQCRPDSRFAMQNARETKGNKQKVVDVSRPVKGSILPIVKSDLGFLGRNKGIQGHYNSCYMDSSLFAMFGYSHYFDVMLNRKKRATDIKEYDDVQTILKEHIVNPLRKYGFVGHPSVLQLRKYLNDLCNIGGFMTEEKDPEEFIVLLFEKVLNVDPFIKLCGNNREEVSHLYQIFCSKDEKNVLPSIQYLLENSFLFSNLKLADIPSVMILQMPRFGQEKLFNRIQITSTLDITPLLADKIHSCVMCGESTTKHCPDCACLFGWDNVHTFLCDTCWVQVHNHPKRKTHKNPIDSIIKGAKEPSGNTQLELFAVVCIEKSHYVSFVKCGYGEDETWLFFDSMADRIGGENGHNVPQVTVIDNLKQLLNGTPQQISELDKKQHELVMRVFDDASLCFYCNKSLTMYR